MKNNNKINLDDYQVYLLLIDNNYHHKDEDINNVASIIKKLYNYDDIKYIGNNHKIKGDYQIISNNIIKYLELKITNGNNGTLANIGQNSITDYKLIENVVNWSDFREKIQHQHQPNYYKGWKQRLNFIIQNYYSENNIICEKNKKYLYKSIKNYKDLKDYIELIDRNENKIEYIKYLQQYGFININNIKKFIFNIFSGNNSKNTYDHNIDIFNDNIDYLYYNKKTKKYKIINYANKHINYDNLKLEFHDNKTFINISNSNHSILKLVFHWKNKGQGVESPCINVFSDIII